MKTSYNWLKHYVDFGDINPNELSIILTNSGLEVEGLEEFESVKGGLENIIIGEVLTCEKHSNADKLFVTTVNIGGENPLHIVCGAPNVAAGQKVLVAPVGTTIYMNEDPFEIKKTKIRGELSEGMICAEDEVGLGDLHEGIIVLDNDVQVGLAAKEHFNVTKDWVFEIGLTPNRTDGTSHIGVARDIVACLNQQKHGQLTLKKPSVQEFKIDNHNKKIEIDIQNIDACPRYSGITISNITVKESPSWLQNYLNAVGIRPINNVVDITNFVLMETGQPLHAFDADKIKGEKVVVRKARKDEKFVTLDEVERELQENDLMICDINNGICIAGVFGGEHSGVILETKNIFIESAYFDPHHIRKTSKHHNLDTNASFRFERGADPNITIYALKRASLLIKELAGGEISSDIVDVYPKPIKNWRTKITYENVSKLIGKEISKENIKRILKDLEIEIIEESKDGLELSVPTFRFDVRREVDVIEEILRIYGYNNIEIGEKLKLSISESIKPDPEKAHEIIADYLSNNGFSEIMNNSLTKPWYSENIPGFNPQKNVVLFNPLSKDLNVMRQSLLFGGLESILYNQNRKIFDLKMFEFGNTYLQHVKNSNKEKPLEKFHESKHLGLFLTGNKNIENWNAPPEKVDFYYLKSLVDQIINRMHLDRKSIKLSNDIPPYLSEGITYLINNDKLAEIGCLDMGLLNQLDIKSAVYFADINWNILFGRIINKDIQYHEIPKYPEVIRDIALLIDTDVLFEDIKNKVIQADKHIIKSVGLFDVYEGDKIEKGKKSYAIRIVFQDPQRTLTDKVVDKLMNKIIQSLEASFSATIR